MKQFGVKQPGQNYTLRPASHLIIFGERDRLLAVKYKEKYFLPGGGVEHNESFEEAAHREMAEEVGWTVRIEVEFFTAGEYVDIPEEGLYINKVGHFFIAEILDTRGKGKEDDHEPVWVTVQEFATKAAHESHIWAVRRAVSSRGR